MATGKREAGDVGISTVHMRTVRTVSVALGVENPLFLSPVVPKGLFLKFIELVWGGAVIAADHAS